jgi:hypothetical protein
MAKTPPVQLKIPVITLTQQEIDDTRELIDDGRLPRDWFDQYAAAREKHVFGHDVQHDRNGNPIEQGIGSASQPTRNSIEAYKSHQMGNKFGPEPGFENHLAKMESDLAAFEARKASERAARRNARA